MSGKIILKGTVNGREMHYTVCNSLQMMCHGSTHSHDQLNTLLTIRTITCFGWAAVVCLRTQITWTQYSIQLSTHVNQKTSLEMSLSATLVSAQGRVHLLKLFNVCLLILCILWTGFVNKNKGIKKRAYKFHSPISAWKVSHFSGYSWPKYSPNTWKPWGLSALQLTVSIRSLFFYPFPFYLSSFLDSSTERLTHFKLRSMIKTCPPITSATPVHKPIWAFHSLQPCIIFQSNSFH